jgi:hypothetical protein
MLNELKILFDNIKTFRHLITEAVGQEDMVKYIENHELVYIYYAGDGKNPRGQRTIRPYVLGTNTSGHLVIRAWQEKGRSADFMNAPTREPSVEHDYWDTSKGKVAGWRMFRLDKIEKLYPIGRKFNNPDGTVMIPDKYKEGSDADIPNIIAYVSTKTEPITEPTPVSGTTKAVPATWGDKNTRNITANEVTMLRNIARDVYKERIGKFYVAVNGNGEFVVVRDKSINKVPKNAVVGSLTGLYDKLVNKNVEPDQQFFKAAKQKFDSETKNQQKNTEQPTIPFEKKSFFKP